MILVRGKKQIRWMRKLIVWQDKILNLNRLLILVEVYTIRMGQYSQE